MPLPEPIGHIWGSETLTKDTFWWIKRIAGCTSSRAFRQIRSLSRLQLGPVSHLLSFVAYSGQSDVYLFLAKERSRAAAGLS
jgi:hypothetical protein